MKNEPRRKNENEKLNRRMQKTIRNNNLMGSLEQKNILENGQPRVSSKVSGMNGLNILNQASAMVHLWSPYHTNTVESW